MRVLFAPDYRPGTPYQTLLADALREAGVTVDFLSDYYRGLPLTRGLAKSQADLLHLHWPEPYAHFRGRWRQYFPDLFLARRMAPLVLTAHNGLPHENLHSAIHRACHAWTYQLANAVIAHSDAAAEVIRAEHGIKDRRLRVIPHGNEAAAYPALTSRESARKELGLRLPPNQRLALMFGAFRPYKGQDAVLDWWRQNAPPRTTLALVGKAAHTADLDNLHHQTKDRENLLLRPEYQDETDTARWHAAADVAVFNYRQIFSSGTVNLALGAGLPVLLPARCPTVDVSDVPGRALRFFSLEGDFGDKLGRQLELGRSPQAARQWAISRDWAKIAESTAQIYASLI